MAGKQFMVEFIGPDKDEAKQARSAARALRKEQAKTRAAERKAEELEKFPEREFSVWGPAGGQNLRGARVLAPRPVRTTSHTASTAYPFVAGPGIGAAGLYLGRDQHGGGAFCFDPWSLYEAGIISGMSMMLFGQVGTGKSSLAKSLAVRQVLAGRKLSVASDKKGEWTRVVKGLGGVVIQVGPGLDTRLNPLDPGVRPSTDVQGEPMTDRAWEMMVRTRRMSILVTLARILTDRDLTSPEHHVLSAALDTAVETATEQGRVPVIPDVIAALEARRADADAMAAEAASVMMMTLARVSSGDLAGMFDGETTATLDAGARATSIDTSALRGASPEAVRVVNACAGAWTEAMITTRDGGQRIVIYEEGWDNISSEADLRRMVEQWKLARAYGIFNILVLHKIADLDMAGDQNSKMAAMAKSLLADADVKVIYRQDRSALSVTTSEMELSDRERSLVRSLPKGTGLWRLGDSSFEVKNELTNAELPLFDTDERMDKKKALVAGHEA
ncbi:conjugal transfer protein TraC [Micrococcus sp.]|uniref:conjugal transfer protein TraC n=1 Tax=Micrococcus sp. TaxID=1271 RepID=UPI0026DD0DC3|nr:conjugal transfer protein TraC [Micrococcus sp.]MDO4240806.1 conjugal transfer protein TraC [Micrococcus sp.]